MISKKIWGESENEKMREGIASVGMGRLSEIREQFLPDWSIEELKIKIRRLIGRQNLSLYVQCAWSGNSDQIAKEKSWNEETAKRLHAWKGGVMVYDDAGVVAAECKKRADQYRQRQEKRRDAAAKRQLSVFQEIDDFQEEQEEKRRKK